MKSVFVATFVLCLTLTAAAQVTHVKFSNAGQFVSVTGNPDPLSTFTVTVSKTSSTTSGTNTTLSYQAFSVASDFNSETFTIISGSIPDSDFTGQNTNNLAVNIDTSQLDPTTTFEFTCTIDFTTFTETCGTPAPGLIQLTFLQNDINRTQVLALETVQTLGSLTIRNHQKSDNSSATVQGSIFGTPVSGGSGTVGVNHSATIEVTKL